MNRLRLAFVLFVSDFSLLHVRTKVNLKQGNDFEFPQSIKLLDKPLKPTFHWPTQSHISADILYRVFIGVAHWTCSSHLYTMTDAIISFRKMRTLAIVAYQYISNTYVHFIFLKFSMSLCLCVSFSFLFWFSTMRIGFSKFLFFQFLISVHDTFIFTQELNDM